MRSILPVLTTQFCYFILLIRPLLAVEAPHATSRWSIEDVLLAETAGSFEVSPDGKRVVWVQRRMDAQKGGMVSNLYMSEMDRPEPLQLTRGKNRDKSPRWSPDGNRIAFLSDRALPDKGDDDKVASEQIWMISLKGGEPWPITTLKRAMKDYRWRDKRTIVFIAQEDPSWYEQEFKAKKDTSRVVEDVEHEPPVRLFLLDVESGEIRRVTMNNDWIESLSVSPNGKWAVTVHQKSLSFEYDQKILPESYLVNLNDGTLKPLMKGERFIVQDVQWDPTSQGFYFITPYSTHPQYFQATINRLYYYDLTTDVHREVDLEWTKGVSDAGYRMTQDGFVALLADGLRYKAMRYRKQEMKWIGEPLQGEPIPYMFDFDIARDGKAIVYSYSTPSIPEQWFVAKLRGTSIQRPMQLTKLNPRFTSKRMPRVEIIRWTGSLGDTVEGLLYYPFNYMEGTKYPLILMIHGGPTGVDLDAWTLGWSRPIPLLLQEGAFVLRANYHGSGNYGLAWAESIGGGKYYDLEVPDLEAGVDTLIERGLVDPDRLATVGWSNGAILSTALVTHSHRFRAAVVGAGDVEWISDWGNVDFGAAFDNYYLGASPIENPTLYIKKSPFFQLPEVNTPMLIFTGTEDRNVPPSQSWSHYRAMQQAGKTDVRFVLFPGEPHGLLKYVHQYRKVEEELRWLKKYLFGKEQPNDEVLKEGSWLDLALLRLASAQSHGRYGIEENGVLMPETVPYKGIHVGRFEVTRAQFKAFRPEYNFPAGTDNYPVYDVDFSTAQAYCDWLTKVTGRKYRLPTEAEGEVLYKDNDKREGNTLDAWAGYDISPVDVMRLQALVKKLGDGAPLLMEPGHFVPAKDGDVAVFDLIGNVAEWVITKNGSGKLQGGSADRPFDTKSSNSLPDTQYRGFRVVLENP